jgi:arginase family enzyme
VVLGGDHSITEGVLNARAKKSPVHLVLFDAHTDDYEDSSELQKHRPLHHGNWLARGLKSGAVSGVTMRDGNRDVAPRKYLKAVPRNKPVHLSIDLDVLSTNTIGMATSYPEAGGYSLDELLRELRLLNLQGRTDVTADLTEYDPTRDRNGVAGWCAATIVTELLSIIGS